MEDYAVNPYESEVYYDDAEAERNGTEEVAPQDETMFDTIWNVITCKNCRKQNATKSDNKGKSGEKIEIGHDNNGNNGFNSFDDNNEHIRNNMVNVENGNGKKADSENDRMKEEFQADENIQWDNNGRDTPKQPIDINESHNESQEISIQGRGKMTPKSRGDLKYTPKVGNEPKQPGNQISSIDNNVEDINKDINNLDAESNKTFQTIKTINDLKQDDSSLIQKNRNTERSKSPSHRLQKIEEEKE